MQLPTNLFPEEWDVLVYNSKLYNLLDIYPNNGNLDDIFHIDPRHYWA